MRTTHEGEKKTYEKLRTMVLTHIALRQQNKVTAAAQNTFYNSAAAAADGPRKGDCNKWMKTGNCAAGRSCPFAHDDANKGSKKKSKGGKGSGEVVHHFVVPQKITLLLLNIEGPLHLTRTVSLQMVAVIAPTAEVP